MLANENIQKLQPYISIPHKIWHLKNKNESVLKLDWNEATVPPSPKVIDSLKKFLTSGNLQWYPNTRNQSLLEKISSYTNQKDSSFIEIFASSDAACEHIIDTFLEKQETIGIVSPTYDNFRARAQGVGIQVRFFDLEEDFSLDFGKLEFFVRENNIKLLYICNPNNPTGKAYNTKDMENLIRKYENIVFLIDEAYYEFYGETLENLTSKYKNLIITRTFSKAFALAGFRIGYVVSHYENISALRKLKNPKSVSMLSQIAARAALEDLEYMKAYTDEVKLARAYFTGFLNKNFHLKMGGIAYESVANFVLMKIKNVSSFVKFLENENIFIRDYSHIIAEHCRVSIGTRKQMRMVAEKIQKFINLQGGQPC